MYRDSHYEDKTVLRPSYLYNGNPSTWKPPSLYRDSPYRLLGRIKAAVMVFGNGDHSPLKIIHLKSKICLNFFKKYFVISNLLRIDLYTCSLSKRAGEWLLNTFIYPILGQCSFLVGEWACRTFATHAKLVSQTGIIISGSHCRVLCLSITCKITKNLWHVPIFPDGS